MKPHLRQALVPTLLVIAAAVVLVNAWIAVQSVKRLATNSAWVAHSWQVVQQVERVIGFAVDAETSERAYLISRDERFLDTYERARQNLPPELARLQQLTGDNPAQQQRVADLRATLDRRLPLLEHAIAQRRNNGSADAGALLSLSGKMEMDHLRSIGEAMEGEEARLLTIRNANTASSVQQAEYAVVFASALDFALLVLAFLQSMRERQLRVAAETVSERLEIASRETQMKAEEISLLNATLEERVRVRTTELERINRELEAFSYSVSHDLRAPLRTIDGFSLALQEDYMEAVDETGRDYIQRVRGGVQRMGHLIDALLQLSRVTRSEVMREPFKISEMAASIAAEFKEQNPGRELVFHIENGLVANGDEQLVRVALENLLGNAVKFSSKVPRAEITFGWDREHAAWYVRDNGAGFDMTYAGKLFGAFNRLHGDRDFKGSGIGLATVARVIQGHHGTIWADSTVDHGATFWFTLEQA